MNLTIRTTATPSEIREDLEVGTINQQVIEFYSFSHLDNDNTIILESSVTNNLLKQAIEYNESMGDDKTLLTFQLSPTVAAILGKYLISVAKEMKAKELKEY